MMEEPMQIAESWKSAGPAAFDFRTDTTTTPSYTMLQAISQSTLMDDVYEEDTTTTNLESHMVTLTGKESALLVLSGTMGNQIALRSLLTQPPHAILCHSRSHILLSEAGGCSSLSQAHMQPVTPANGLYLTLEDVQREAVLSTNIHVFPTRVVSLENTLGGAITPLAECQRISRFARENGILMHLDGARIWEAVATGVGSLPEFLACFDTAQLCFSKGLGAPIGSIIVGPRATLQHSRWVRKSIGGGIRQAGIIASAARVAIDEQFGRGPNGEGGRLRGTHDVAKRIEAMWIEKGGRVSRVVQTNMVFLDLGHSGVAVSDLIAAAKAEGVKVMGARIVVHYQIVDEAVEKLGRAFDAVLSGALAGSTVNGQDEGKSVYN